MVDNQWLDVFGQLGFNSHEINILIHLYKHQGSQKADDISDATGVPLTRTYEALDTLTNDKFVIKHEGRPRKYEAISPQQSLAHFIAEEERKSTQKLNKTKRLANEGLELAQDLYIAHHTQIEPDELLEQFGSLDEAQLQTIRLIQDAEEEIFIFSHVFQWYYDIKPHLLEARNRGCTVRVLMQISEVDPATTKDEIRPIDVDELKEMGIEVKNVPTSEIMTRGTLVDRKYVVFVIWADPQKSKERRIYRPQFSSNQGIVDVFYGYFNHLWN